MIFALTYFVIAWMRSPGKIDGMPSLLPLAFACAMQFPIFGAFSLIIGRPRVYIIGMIRVLGFFLSLVTEAGPWVALIANVIAGAALIWISYRRWCRAEVL